MEWYLSVLKKYAVFSGRARRKEYPGVAVSVRRLHDTGRSGWWLLIGLIPLIGVIVLLVFMVQEGKSEGNDFGENPKLVAA
jgi:uncharacterized membrane protein YhaH (DUF805 family)